MNNNTHTYLINGKNFVCELEKPVLQDLIEIFLQSNNKKISKIAVAVNDILVERWKWKKKKIYSKDKIEIVAPFFGG